MKQIKLLNRKRTLRKARVRAKIFGTAERPRLALFRSNRFVYAQLIDDVKSDTLVRASSKELRDKKKTKTDMAKMAGELLAERALKKGIKTAVFDRRSYKYHGRAKAFVEGVRNGGLLL